MSLQGYKPKTRPALWQSAFPNQKKPAAPGKRRRVSPVSANQRARLKEYASRREAFLAENKWCPVVRACRGKRERTTMVHHIRGRVGNLLLDERYWLAVSWWGHRTIHEQPKWASQRGWLAGKGEWNKHE